jgi:hypothetical protein
MNTKRVLREIKHIRESNLTHREKEIALHNLERKHQDELFIKTDLCPNCGHLTVDVWFKKERFSMETEKVDSNGLSKNHHPPKKNLGSFDDNVDEKGNINP